MSSFKDLFYFNYVYMFLSVHGYGLKGGVGAPESGVTGTSELPDMGAGNWSGWVFWQSNICS